MTTMTSDVRSSTSSAPSNATRVLLVDDHRLLRQGLKSLLDREPGIDVVAEADDGRSAVELAAQLRPDVVLMDVSMPGLNGIDATRRLLEICPECRVLALTAHSDRNLIREMLRAGAVGYVVKDSAVEELVNAVRATVAGRTYLSPRIAGLVVEGFVEDQGPAFGAADDAPRAGVFNRLTPREREVLQLMAEGKATKEVALALHVSVKTAETHRRAIMEKLNLYSVAELTKYALREGLTTLD